MHSRSTICRASSGEVHSRTNSSSRARSASGGACAASPISCRRICARGPNITSSSKGLARPFRTLVSSGSPATNSSATRLLPIPASPNSVTRWPRRVSRAPSNASCSSRSSRLRFTSGIVLRPEPGWSAATGHARASSSNPLASTSRIGPYWTCDEREEVARLGDEHGARVGGLLQPRRHVHRGAVEQALLGRLAPDRDRTRVDAHADPERDRQPDLLPEATDPLDELEPGAHRAERVVVVRVLQAEHADDGVPGEVVGAAAERLELLGDHAVVAGQDLAVALGIDLARDLGRPHQVDEDHRDELALLRRRRAHRVAAVRAEPSLVGQGKPAPFTRQGRHAQSLRGRDDASPRERRLPADPEPLDVEDRAGSLGFGLDDDLDAFADLERLLARFEHPMDQHRVRAVEPDGAEGLGALERLTLDPLRTRS